MLPAPCASDALRLCRFKTPDLLLLDLRLPDASGLDVLREIRGTNGATGRYDPGLPVIVLTGRSSEPDRVRGLETGADDYLAKPFSYVELAARIQAVLRRRETPRQRPAARRRAVRRSGRGARCVRRRRVVRLANKEFELLRALASEPERVFTKQELLAGRLGLPLDGPHPHPRLARKPAAPQARPEHGRFVQNVWGVGYRLVGGLSGTGPPVRSVARA